MFRKIVMGLSFILLVAGLFFVCYPFFKNWLFTFNGQKQIQNFENYVETANEDADGQASEDLKKEMEAYNHEIYLSGQQDLKDAWSYQTETFDLANYDIENEMIGYLDIPQMNVSLPLYLGASNENLAKGAAVLSQTSMPIGGENTNCVIAAHRGWKGIPMFKDIEKLKIGDQVELTNLWGTMHYRVMKTAVIAPNDIDAVKIIEGADMITLITCHPYPYNYQRYVVYCVRDEDENAENDDQNVETVLDKRIDQDQRTVSYSQSEIDKEKNINLAGIAAGFFFCVLIIFSLIRRKKKTK